MLLYFKGHAQGEWEEDRKNKLFAKQNCWMPVKETSWEAKFDPSALRAVWNSLN